MNDKKLPQVLCKFKPQYLENNFDNKKDKVIIKLIWFKCNYF